MIKNILTNINSYNSEMSISQVIRFFDTFGMSFTKTMIQNYIRVGVLPVPVRKRYYVKSHLIILAMIYELKEIYSLPEIEALFKSHANLDDENDLIVLYNEYLSLFEQHNNSAKSAKMLSLMTGSVAMKKNVKNMMDNESL